jgi:hypothetical protein
MNIAPIAFFAYKRPSQTLKALSALAECELASQSKLYIFCDGAKRPEDQEQVDKVREIAASRMWCGEVNIVRRDVNLGLANSIMEGVTKLCADYGRVIVLEDDLIVARGFLSYMNKGLELYKANPMVMQISGHRFPFTRGNDDGRAFFMPIINSWGWSTWDRAWSLFDANAVGWERLAQDKKLRKRFDLDGSYPFSSMLFDQMSGRIDSWAIRWWWSFFLNDGLCLYPSQSLVRNIGFGEGASHTTDQHCDHDDPSWDPGRHACDLPERIVESSPDFMMLKRYLKKTNSPRKAPVARVLGRLKRMFF